MTIPPGIQTEGTRNSDDVPPDSALNVARTARESGSLQSRSDAQTRGRAEEQTLTSRIRQTSQAIALARIVADLRPDWAPAEVHAWALNDDRPWATVVHAAITGAMDHGIQRVAGLRHVNPDTRRSDPTPIPPPLSEHRAFLRSLDRAACPHGDLRDRCALCRYDVPAEEAHQ